MMSIKEMFISEEPRVDLLDITPAMAKAILEECNTSNRKLRNSAVTKYSRDMENDNWLFDGMPIRFKSDGILFDGQHRLSAIVKSNISQKTVVVLGLDEDSQLVMDNGVKRTVRDNVNLVNGTNYSATICTAINLVCKATINGECKKMSYSDVQFFIDRYKKEVDFVSSSIARQNKKGIGRATIPAVAIKALISGENENTVLGFLNSFYFPKYGEMTKGEITVQRLRDRLICSPSLSGGSYQYNEMKMIERTYEAYKDDIELSRLAVPKEYVFRFVDIDNLYKEARYEQAS